MLTKENIRTLIGIINILLFIFLIFIIIFYFANLFPNVLKVLYLLIKILVILRCMRVILLMKNFSEFQAIFKTVHNMKTLFSELINTPVFIFSVPVILFFINVFNRRKNNKKCI